MTKQELISYVRDYYSVNPDYPWDDENYVLRHGNSSGTGTTKNGLQSGYLSHILVSVSTGREPLTL